MRVRTPLSVSNGWGSVPLSVDQSNNRSVGWQLILKLIDAPTIGFRWWHLSWHHLSHFITRVIQKLTYSRLNRQQLTNRNSIKSNFLNREYFLTFSFTLRSWHPGVKWMTSSHKGTKSAKKKNMTLYPYHYLGSAEKLILRFFRIPILDLVSKNQKRETTVV